MTLEFRSASRFTRSVFDACPIIWTDNKKGVRRMEKVDALIEALAEYIIEKISAGDVYSEVAEETKALAALISARANVL